MPIFAETESKIFGDVIYDIVNNTNITRASPGSKTKAIAQAMSKKLGRMWAQFDLNMVQAYLSGAEGMYLDFIGSMMGVTRIGESTASASSAEKVVRFYVDTGTFGDINDGSSIVLPIGTLVSTQVGGEGITYRLSSSVVLAASSTEQYVSVQALTNGQRANVGAKQLIYHTFISYVGYLQNTLKVVNEADISTGGEVESDPNYRFRIANQVVSAEAANETALRLAALGVPGVADVVMIPYFRGVGTGEILIKAVTPSVSQGLINSVDVAVRRLTAWGNIAHIRRPFETGVSLQATVMFKKQLPASEQNTILSNCNRNLVDYINNLDIGEDLIVNEMVQRVMETSDNIKDMGSAGKPFDKLWVYRESFTSDNKIRASLLGNYKPNADEKLIVETVYAGQTPILIQAAV